MERNVLLSRIKNRNFRIRIGLVLGYLVLMVMILPRAFRLDYSYEIGKKWQSKTLKAPFDFAIYKSPQQLTLQKQLAASQVPDVYQIDSVGMQDSRREIRRELTEVFEALQTLELARQAGDSISYRQQLQRLTSFQLSETNWQEIGRISGSEETEQIVLLADRIAVDVYARGYLDQIRTDTTMRFISLGIARAEEAYVPVDGLITNQAALIQLVERQLLSLPPEVALIMRQLIIRHLQPNYLYNEGITRSAIAQRMGMVSPLQGKVKENEVIIENGQMVTETTAEIIESLILEQKNQFGSNNRWLTYLGQFLIVTTLTLLLLVHMSVYRPRIYFDNRKLSLILFTYILAVSGMVVATKLTEVAERLQELLGPNVNLSYIYLAPACLVPIFISSFFDNRLAFLANFVVALYGAVLVQQSLEYAYIQTIAGTVAVYSIRRMRKRETFFFSLGYIFLAYAAAYISYNLLSKNSFDLINYNTLLLFAINVLLTVIAYNLIYLLERLFGVTSDLTYLELLDTNHPLLLELARKAPGTFQHSLQVANISEATILEIGGNALLTHVGALYHDIGKMANAHYFIENMSEEDKEHNPHSKISCEESAEIIIGHVKQGIEEAHRYHLPKEIIRFIETHHGTTRVEYFYRQYIREKQCNEPTGEELFRYPGPLPYSKETAVLMIADSIEAASRSMKHPTFEKLDALVDKIIDFKINDRQLENSSLTFKDLAIIRKSLKKQLHSIYHGRIEYPKENVLNPTV